MVPESKGGDRKVHEKEGERESDMQQVVCHAAVVGLHETQSLFLSCSC